MAGGGASSASKSSNAQRLRKRVEAESAASSALKRAKDGSAFAKCDECNKDVPVALISFHNCSLDAKIQMNLDTIDVEIAGETKKKPAVEKKKPKSTEPKAKKENKAKNKNAPKRPLTAFFLFMNDFRKSFKVDNPDCKSVATVGKEGGVKWKAMSDDEKKVYIDKAAELKAEYEKTLESNNAENEQDEGNSSEIEEVEEDKDVEENEAVEEKEVVEIEVEKEKQDEETEAEEQESMVDKELEDW